jgi:hypothetical protein
MWDVNGVWQPTGNRNRKRNLAATADEDGRCAVDDDVPTLRLNPEPCNPRETLNLAATADEPGRRTVDDDVPTLRSARGVLLTGMGLHSFTSVLNLNNSRTHS